MNNKALGTQFEREMCDILSKKGFWVHFMSPDNSGAQPCDLIFAKDGQVQIADCKTCVAKSFTIDRLEDNQIFAFERWIKCGNSDPVIFVKHHDAVYKISYSVLKCFKRITFAERSPFCTLSPETK